MLKNSKFITAAALFLFGLSAQAATLNIGGNYRFGANLLVNPDLANGTPAGQGGTATYLEHRALIRPDIIVDDRFTVKSEFSLLQTAPTSNDVPEGFGSALDRNGNQLNGQQLFYVRKVYLEWASDWGIFRFGRQPKAWGLGLLYHAGNDPLDDYASIVDRAGFQAMLGNLGINVGYEKGAEGLLKSDGDDVDTYEMSLEYSNAESLFDVGILYARNRRAGNPDLVSSHDMSIFTQKKWRKFQLGGEFANLREDKRGSVIGLLGQADYNTGRWAFGADLAIATASTDSRFVFHPNYQPFLILFRQSVGPNFTANSTRGGQGGNAGVGAPVASGDGAGAFLTKAHVDYTFPSKMFTLGTDFGYATLVRQGNATKKALGFEADLHFSQKWYENFSTTYALGLLVPGGAYGGAERIAWGLQIRGALTF